MNNPEALVQLSGGIDSTYVLYHWLKDNPNKTILVHHIHLKNNEGRLEYEKKAVDSILNYLREHGLDNFVYIESTFDYGNMGWIIKDVEVCGFFLGIILRNQKWTNLKKILMPIYKPEAGSRHKRAERIRNIVSLHREIEVEFPLLNMKKAEVMQGLPKELLDMTWYCRKPVNGKVCGVCITCKDVNKK